MSKTNRRKFLATTGVASLAAMGVKAMSTDANSAPAKKSNKTLDLTDVPVVDHHSHDCYEKAMSNPDPAKFVAQFYHGSRVDGLPKDGNTPFSKNLYFNISNTGVVLAAVTELSRLFACEATLEAVVAERVRRVRQDPAAYTKMLYDKAKITDIVLDSASTKKPELLPGKIWRLVPGDKFFEESLKSCDNLETFRKTFIDKIDERLSDPQYIAVKNHVGEQTGLDVVELPLVDYQNVYKDAQNGDKEAKKKIYRRSFIDLCQYCCEKDVPIHIHTGTTGDMRTIPPIDDALDPLLLAPFLKRKELSRLKVVLLHGGHPWVQHTALMAYNFPNVYMDMSWMFPWNVLGLKTLYEEAISIAPLSKMFYGGGMHTGPETGYMGAIVLKKVVSSVFTDLVDQGFLTMNQATDAAHGILYKNAERLYGFKCS